jgi:hypothetical protein
MLAPRFSPFSLPQRGLERITDGAGLTILCLKGELWVTQEGDSSDVVLSAGESLLLERNGLTVLYALTPASATLLTQQRPQ